MDGDLEDGRREGGRGQTYVHSAGEGVDYLVCADVVVDEDVGAVFYGLGAGGEGGCGHWEGFQLGRRLFKVSWRF